MVRRHPDVYFLGFLLWGLLWHVSCDHTRAGPRGWYLASGRALRRLQPVFRTCLWSC